MIQNSLAIFKALRLPSQLYILTPIVLGVLIGLYEYGQSRESYYISIRSILRDPIVLMLFGFSLSIQFYIILANDIADEETDKINEHYTPFSGGSRVLANGVLSRNTLIVLSNMFLILALLTTLSITYFGYISTHLPSIKIFIHQRSMPGMPIFWVLSYILLQMYSYPPFRLSYRGGGEWLQVLGLGIVLPIMGYYSITGNIISFPWIILISMIPTHWACSVSTALPDHKSDTISQKRTIPVQLGIKSSKILISAYNLVSIILVTFLLNNSWLGLIPGTLWMLSNFFSHAQPGNRSMIVYVFLNISITLSIQWLILYYFGKEIFGA